RGFVARLSGSTAEMLNIWLLMSAGKEPFFINEKGELNLRFTPALPSWLFTKTPKKGLPKNTYAFKFLGKTLVVYHNPKMKDTAGKSSAKAVSITIEYDDGRKVDIQKDTIGQPYSSDIRHGKVKRIDIHLS
ncbi:MAG: cellobiose phosphorylase, partial [Candidatus Omnitrophica bacterium]|nr:cellobiose phosphorylase [Candidatus Omnitrophota bacterium]